MTRTTEPCHGFCLTCRGEGVVVVSLCIYSERVCDVCDGGGLGSSWLPPDLWRPQHVVIGSHDDTVCKAIVFIDADEVPRTFAVASLPPCDWARPCLVTVVVEVAHGFSAGAVYDYVQSDEERRAVVACFTERYGLATVT